jgi:nicotinamide mononucleotide (NMN) deamidase PncC
MPKFTVILTRDVTESCVIEVEADSEEVAAEMAHEALSQGEGDWTVDDGSCGTSSPYITDISPAVA